MELEVFKRPLKPGDIVSGSGAYQGTCYLYVVIGFTAKNVKVSPLTGGYSTLKSEVVLISDAKEHFLPAHQTKYDAICKKYNIK